MSVSTNTMHECSHCHDERDPHTSIKGSFCSLECYWSHKGENVIRQVQNDHTHCSSCYARIKCIAKPPGQFLERIGIENGEHTKQAIIGFEYSTENLKRAHGFTYCRCGNVDHHAEIHELQEVDLKDVLVNLWTLLVRYYRQGQFGDHKPSRDVLFQTLKETGFDWEHAIGKAVFDP